VEKQGTAEERYEQLVQYRQAYHQAAYNSAALTIPALVPTTSDSKNKNDRTRQALPVPAQSLGARGVNNLSAKMLLALFPPNTPLFRYVVSADLQLESSAEELTYVNEMLAERESVVTSDIEQKKYRPKLIEAFKQLIVSGNVLLLLSEGQIRVFRMDRYVVKRDPMGRVDTVVVRESFSRENLPERIQKIVDEKLEDSNEYDKDQDVDVYTCVKRVGGQFKEYQEVLGEQIEGTEGSFPVDSPRWLPLTFVRVDGEDYGRGYVEEYIGDLTTYDGLSRAIREDAAIAAQTIFMVDPNSPPGLEKALTNAPNGGFVRGDAGMIIASRVDKNADMNVAASTAEQIKADLSYAFLLNSAVQRTGDRVTAEEIREVARELEDTQGGIFSVLSEELILPLVQAHERQLESKKQIAPLPNNMVSPAITTGFDAIGRNHDLVRLTGVLNDIGMLAQLNPKAVEYLNVPGMVAEIFLGHSVSAEGKMLKPEEVEANVQAQQQAAMQAQTQEAVMEGVAGSMPTVAGEVIGGVMSE
jgi:hypothetical protein